MVLGSLTELVKRGKDGTAVVAKVRHTEMPIVPRSQALGEMAAIVTGAGDPPVPDLVNLRKTDGNITIFNGKIHYFDGDVLMAM